VSGERGHAAARREGLAAFGREILGIALLAASAVAASAAPVSRSLTELQVAVYGLSAGVEPASPIVPKQTASGLRIVVKAGARTLSAAEVARLLGGPFEIQAELSGPGLAGALSLPRTGADAIPSPDPLVLTFPGLPHAGDYEIANIRLVRGGRPVLDVQPRRVALRVIEQILVTSVVTRPLTLDEIRERGVVLDASAYLGFEFAITLKLESTPVNFRFPVVFDRQGVPVPIPLQPPPEPLRSVVSAPQLVPVLMRPAAFEGDPDGAPPDYNLEDLPGYDGVRIPSLLVIPGSVGYLKQFFSAQLMVGNGAPGGSGLVVKNVTGTLRIPPGADGQAGTADDPLALPDLESGPQSATLEVRGEGGASELLPGEFGHAELTLRGEREGRHDVDFDIRAELLGLPVGPVPLEGSAHGVVLVRNAYFDVTFTVPTVVRADEEFSVFATVTNIGQGTGHDVNMTLDGSRLSGARLLSAATQTIASLPPGDAATLEYRFRSDVTGEVVASYLRFDTSGGVDVTGRLNFMLGVGERRVAQSPDTLVLPTAVRALPSAAVRAAMRVLGQAWSAATATSLPPGVERPSTEAVFRKGLSVAEAGLRVELGQPMAEALRDLLVDLHGDGLDAGFDQVLRETTAGRDLDRVLGDALAGAAASAGALDYELEHARIAASGSPFLSAALESQGGAARLLLRDGSGRATDAEARSVPGALVATFGAAASAPQLAFVAALDSPPYAVELAGTATGTVGLSLSLPAAGGGAVHARVDGIAVAAGSRHRLVYDPARPGALVLEKDAAGDGVFESREPVSLESLVSAGPRLVSAVAIGPETLEGASPFGTYAALLFDRVVSDTDAAGVSRYEIAFNSVLAAKRQLSGRLVFVALEQPEGPLVPTRIAVSGIRDERGQGGERQELALGSRLLTAAAVVTGRVLEADGTAVPDALVTYLNTSSGRDGGQWDCRVTSDAGVAAQRTDSGGRFTFRYVPQDPCGGPFRLETQDPATGAVRGVKSYVRADGQRMSLDLVLIGHGRVEGLVSHAAGGGPAVGARVRVVSVTDSQIGVVTTTGADGRYAVEGMTVGAVTVTAVHGANLGRGAGRLDAAGGSATVNLTLDGNVDITGVVRTLDDGVLTPVPGVDVVYYVGGTPLGLSVTDSFGQYRLLGVPAGPYRLDAGLNQRDKTSLTGNSVAGQKLVQNLVVEIRDYANYGTVKGAVKKLDGTAMPGAWVSDGIVASVADASGAYVLEGVALAANPRPIQAVSPDGRRTGSTQVLLTTPGQVAEGIDIELSGLGAVAFQVLDAAGAPIAGASVGLQGSCLHPCGCRFSTSDTQGIARFADLPFGPVSARAVVTGAPGAWDTAAGSAVVNSELVAAGGVIRMAGFGSVSGIVTNPNGQPAHGASVELTGLRAVVGGGTCALSSVALGSVATDTTGRFRFEGVHVGPVAARASSVVFPRVVGTNGSVDAAGGAEELELRLVDTMGGVLSGTVWLPDASAGAGPDVEVTASGPIPDVTVRTDAQGHYAFAAVLPAGGYLLTARDTRPGGTGSVVQTRVWLQPAQPAEHDLRLKARGPVRVSVVDGAGLAVENAVVHVTLTESDYPHRKYEGTIDGPGDQPLEFPAVFEGDFSVNVSDNFARGGRASGTVPPHGLPVDVSVQLTSTGRVAGRFLWADRTTPLPFGTVRLFAGGRLIGQQTTLGEGQIGSFDFDFVPAGNISLNAEDPKSGRTGTASGSLTAEGQLLSLDVVAYAVGRVEGHVTLNDQPAAGAEVKLRSGSYSVRVTADGDGHYAVDGVPAGRVYASADLGAGFLAGSAVGEIVAEGETLELPIALRGAGTIEGTLLASGGALPGVVSLVTLEGSGQRQTTTTDDQGRFRFDLVAEGQVTLVADALASIDCDRASFTVTAGETLPATLRLRGTGAAQGQAQGSSGPVAGTLQVTGTGTGCQPQHWTLNLGPSGWFRIPELVGGPVSASFQMRATGGPWLYASDADTVLPGQTTTLTLDVEPSGSISGLVRHDDGVSPAIGAQIRVEGAGGRTAVVATGGDGAFLAQGVPVGAVTIRVSDPAKGGVALVTGLSVAAGATLEAGVIQLLETPLAVVSVTPPDGATGLPVAQPVEVTFNAPLAHKGGMSVSVNGGSRGFGSALSGDARTLTVTPAGAWPDSAEVAVEAGPWVTDVYGRRLGALHVSRFRTIDLSPPRVIAVTPQDGAIQVDVATSVSVRFDELLDTTGDLSALVSLTGAQGAVAGLVTAPAPDTLVFAPGAPLASNTSYAVAVNGARDPFGHVQSVAFTSTFTTPDADAPLLRLASPAPGVFTKLKRPTIRVVVEDVLSGPDASRATLKLDGLPVSPVRAASQLSHVPAYDLADGAHTVEAVAHDRAGNPGSLVAAFQVDTQPPTGALLTAPATDELVRGTVVLAGSAADSASGVSRLSFLRDGQWVAEGSAASGFQASWNSATSSDGPHLLAAQPADAAGNVGQPSPGVRVIVDNRPLTVAFTSPADGSPVLTQVRVAASTSEPVARVEFRAGSGPVVIDDQAPYEATLDVSAEPEGELQIHATAIGFAPETAAAARTILVDRTPPAAPVDVQAESSGDGSALVAGLPGSVELGARVEADNPARAARAERAAYADGAFALRLGGEPGDAVSVVAIDVAGNRSGALVVEVIAPRPVAVPTDGLAVWARGGRGVTVDASGRVSRWADAGPAGNDLHQAASTQRPTRVSDPASGRSLLRFDGTDDFLQLTTRLAGSIRTVFAVVREDASAPSASRTLLGDATTADFYGGWPNWWVYHPPYVGTSASIVNGQTWVNGAVVNGRTTPRPKTLSVVCVETTGGVTASRLSGGFLSGHWKGEVAELIVYERPLSIAERKAVEDYLAFEYLAYEPTAGAPVFDPNGGTFEERVEVELATATPGAHIRYTANGGMPTEASPLYTAPLELTSSTTIRARASRAGMKSSPVSAVSFDKASDFSPGKVADLALWLRSDIGLEADAAGRLQAWRDRSGRGNDLVQANPSKQPLVAPGAVNALSAVRFDGSDDELSFRTRLDRTIRTVFAVVWEDADAGSLSRTLIGDASTADFYGAGINWWAYQPPYVGTSAFVVDGQTWVNGVAVNGRTTPKAKAPAVLCVETTAGVTAGLLGQGYVANGWKGHLAELVIYERALTAFERKSVEDYLALRYAAYAPTAGAPVFAPNGGAFDDSVTVTLATPTAGAAIRYTTDGSEPTEGSPAYAAPLTLTATTTVRARAFRSGMNPSPVALATFTNRADFSPRNLPGLALWVLGDIGVEQDAMSRVLAWRDQSGRGNDLVQTNPSNQPLVAPAAANALPAIRFDGSDDELAFSARLDRTIRTVFAVVWEDADAGNLSRTLIGDGSTADFYGAATNWWVYQPPYVGTSAFVVNGQTWVNGAPVNGRTTPKAKAPAVLCVETTAGVTASLLGGGYVSNHWKGHLAELVVYERALTAFERKSVEDYLAVRYAAYAPATGAPVATPNGGRFDGSVSVSLASPTPGARVHYTTDGSEPTEASARFASPLVFTTSTTLRARAFRTGMSPSPVTSVRFTLASEHSPASVPGLALWVRGDAGLEADSASRVFAWRDQSGRGNDLVQSSTDLLPALAPGAAAGRSAVRFDGSDDALAFTQKLDASIRTLFAVVWEDAGSGAVSRSLLGDATAHDFYGGWPNWWYYRPPYVSASAHIANGRTWVNGAVVDGTATPRPTTLSVLSVETTGGVTASLLGDGTISSGWKGHVAELVVYDRALSALERKSVEDYLALEYSAYVAAAGAPVFTPDGGTFQDSVSVALRSGTPGATIRYTTDGSEPSESSPAYGQPLLLTTTTVVRARAYHPAMTPSPVTQTAFARVGASSPAAIAGLAQWVSSDAGVVADAANRVEHWLDLSGRANHMRQDAAAARPLFVPASGGPQPRLRFDGVDDFFAFASRITTARSVFWVLREDPAATPGYRFLLGDATSWDFHSGINRELWSSAYVDAAIRTGETRFNGSVVDGTVTSRPTAYSVVSLVATGPLEADSFTRDRTSTNRGWWGDVGELLIYDRALTAYERKAVEDYLALKHGLYTPVVSNPVFTPLGTTTPDPVSVTIESEPGAEIRYSTDESEPGPASTLYTGPIQVTTRTILRARAFKAGFQPSAVTTGAFLDTVTPIPMIPPGLALWVRGDAGVTQTGGAVSAWADQSGNGNHLVQTAVAMQPVYMAGAQNGLPVLFFDGSNDSLAFTTRFDGTIRAVFAVLKQNGTPTWRVLLGDATKDDFYPGSTALWSGYASAAVLNGETWLNDAPVSGTSTNRPQTMSVLSVHPAAGVSADQLFDSPYHAPWQGEIAELLVYTQPLTPAHRKSVEDYLNLKYAAYAGTAGVPAISPGGGAFTGSVEVTLTTATPGAEIRYTTDESDPGPSSPLYTGPITLTETTLLQARAFRAGLVPSPIALATFALASDLSPAAVPGLALWARAETGVASDGYGKVSLWRDLSGRGNDLAQAGAAAQPSFVPDAQAGLPVVRFDGVDDGLLFKSRLTTMRSVFWVIREDAAATPNYRFLLGDYNSYDFHSGAARQLWSSYTSSAIRSGETRLNGVAVDGLNTNRPTSLSLVSVVTTDAVKADAFTRDRGYGRTWWGDLAELVVYDRALTPTERKAVEDHLALKYALYTPTLAPPQISPPGSTGAATVRVTLEAQPGAEIRYTTDRSDPGPGSALYEAPLDFSSPTTLKARAFRAGFNPSAVATARFLDDVTLTPLRVAGLKLWVKADAQVTAPGGAVSAWADQSGNGNHLVQTVAAAQPQLVAGAVNGLPALRFDGTSDWLPFTTRLTNVRTVFWVVRRDASATGSRMVLGDTSSYHFSSDSTTKIWSSAYTLQAVKDGETRLNGVAVDGLVTDRPTSMSLLSVVTTGDAFAANFGRDRSLASYWWGDLAELLIFDRALGETERLAIEGYLADKYALYTPSVVAPWVSPNGGRVSGPTLVQLGSDTPGVTLRYTLDDSEPVEASPLYQGPFEITGDARVRARAFRAGWNPSAETVVTFQDAAAFTPARLPGLALWTRADAGVASDRAQWDDQGGGGNALVQAGTEGRPSVVFDTESRMPVLRFDGVADTMLFTRRLTGIRSVFWVVRRSEAATPGYRFLLGDSAGYPFSSDTTTRIWSSSNTATAIRNGQTRLNGALVDGTTTDRPLALSVISLVTTASVSADAMSRDRGLGRSWWGDLAELVIFERALSTEEVQQVEAYLADRYGIGLAP